MPPASTPVILLGGASGSGKSYLAQRFGDPHVPLDEFYRQITEDNAVTPFPRTPYGEIDWDHPGTWSQQLAINAILELLHTGRTQVPNYSIATSTYDGYRKISGRGGAVIAEGIFISEVLEPLGILGVNVQAYYVDEPALLTALRRFVRDVSERRKPIPFLLKRGYALYRAHGAAREMHRAKGFTVLSKPKIKKVLARLTAQRPPVT